MSLNREILKDYKDRKVTFYVNVKTRITTGTIIGFKNNSNDFIVKIDRDCRVVGWSYINLRFTTKLYIVPDKKDISERHTYWLVDKEYIDNGEKE